MQKSFFFGWVSPPVGQGTAAGQGGKERRFRGFAEEFADFDWIGAYSFSEGRPKPQALNLFNPKPLALHPRP